ncbi:MAG: choice-of-anchor tandem repeat GloVer-containing protein [Rhodospirillales bacterium]
MPTGGLIEDSAGNLYGATESAGANGGGTVFELSPTANSWTLKVLADLPAGAGGPVAALTMDAAGNLYGTNYMNGANGVGSVFKLTNVSGSWKYQVLHDFAGAAGGSYPGGGVVLDSNGNLFGTAGSGGAYGWGVAYEITP